MKRRTLTIHSVENALKKFHKLLQRLEALEQFRTGFLKSLTCIPQERASQANEQSTHLNLTAWSNEIAVRALDMVPSSAEDGYGLVQAAVCYG